VTISQPGSYYLTHNITVTSGDAIDITTNDVTLDLNGFTISSTETTPTGYGIKLARSAGNTDITIFNGHIKGGVTNNGSGTYSGPGFNFGIAYNPPSPLNVRVTGVSVSGCLNYGIYLGTGNSTVVESCTVQNIATIGITASTVSHSTVNQCGNIAINADNASDCYGYATGSGTGVSATTANNCYGSSGSGVGLSVYTANNCYGSSGSGDGLDADTGANNCTGSSSSGTGVSATTANNCTGSSGGGIGLSADIATGCHGTSTTNTGLHATTALNCYGTSGGGGYGLFATTANNCYGTSVSYIGLEAITTQNCYGYCSGGSVGLEATGSATGCYGQSSTGIGLYALIGNVCHGSSSSGTPFLVTHNVNTF
jgi:hypothetical protein